MRLACAVQVRRAGQVICGLPHDLGIFAAQRVGRGLEFLTAAGSSRPPSRRGQQRQVGLRTTATSRTGRRRGQLLLHIAARCHVRPQVGIGDRFAGLEPAGLGHRAICDVQFRGQLRRPVAAAGTEDGDDRSVASRPPPLPRGRRVSASFRVASIVRLSTSIRNWPLVTTVRRGESLDDLHPVVVPRDRRSHLARREVAAAYGDENDTLRPVSITASCGTWIASAIWRSNDSAVAYMPGLSSKSGLSSVTAR